jgi:lysophosphatidylcholine acyltransferase/lyso-PAF acetyltransferase
MSLFLFLFFYFSITFVVLNYIYLRLIVFYRPIKYKDKETGKEIDLGEKYDPFRPYDPINYFEFILFGLFLFPIRAILSLLICIFLCLNLKYLKYKYKNLDTDPYENEIRSEVIKFWSFFFLFINGIALEKETINYEDIYKKYLGPDYNFKEEKYSLIICNHIGYFDVIANMSINGCGFMAMKIISGMPIGGDIARDMGSIFVERLSESSRKESFDDIMKRQKDFYEGKTLTKIVVFPEGTTSNNQYIVKFKRGVFKCLLPLKPLIMHIDRNAPFHLCSNVTNLFFHVMRCFTCLKNKLYYCELPIIKPTEFMFENYKQLGKEKWEIYSNVVKNMYIEMGKFKSSDLGHRDKDIYYLALESGIYQGEKISK